MAMESSLQQGDEVLIQGLHGKSDLNGLKGRLHKFDDISSRWQVDIADVGFRKVKSDNLAKCAAATCRGRKLCKFGRQCHRPDCWFRHPDNDERCAHFAMFGRPERVAARKQQQTDDDFDL